MTFVLSRVRSGVFLLCMCACVASFYCDFVGDVSAVFVLTLTKLSDTAGGATRPVACTYNLYHVAHSRPDLLPKLIWWPLSCSILIWLLELFLRFIVVLIQIVLVCTHPNCVGSCSKLFWVLEYILDITKTVGEIQNYCSISPKQTHARNHAPARSPH